MDDVMHHHQQHWFGLLNAIKDEEARLTHGQCELMAATKDSETRLTRGQCELTDSVKDAETRLTRGQCEINASIKDGNAGVTSAVRDEARTTQCKLGEGFATVRLESCKNTDEITSAVAAGFSSSMLEGCKNTGTIVGAVSHANEEAQENFSVLQKQISDSATATVVGFKDAQALAYQIEGRTVLDAAKNSNLIQIQADKNAAALGLQAVTFAAAAQLDATKNAAAAQLEAVKNASSIAAQLAACCCELKEKIGADGSETRALVQSIDRDRASRELVNANNEIFYLKSKLPPGTPV